MKILHWYLFKKLMVNLMGGVFLFVMLFIFSRLSEQMNQFIKIAPKTPMSDYILYFVYEIPYTLIYVLPMATMFSIVYVLGKLNEAHELYIFKTTGYSIWYYMSPFLIFIFIAGLAMSYFNEEILYLPHQKHRALARKFRNSEYIKDDDRNNLIQFGEDRKLYVVDKYKVADRSLNKVKIFYVDEENRFNKVLVTDKMQNKEGTTKWTISSFREFELERDRILYRKRKTQLVDTKDQLYYFKRVFHSPQDLSTGQIKKEIDKVNTIGGSKARLLTEYHFKIASPFISVILVFLGVPMATFSRQSVTVISFALVIMTAFLYMVFFNIGISFGKSGIINPFIAGWLGNIAFTIFAAVLNFFDRN